MTRAIRGKAHERYALPIDFHVVRSEILLHDLYTCTQLPKARSSCVCKVGMTINKQSFNARGGSSVGFWVPVPSSHYAAIDTVGDYSRTLKIVEVEHLPSIDRSGVCRKEARVHKSMLSVALLCKILILALAVTSEMAMAAGEKLAFSRTRFRYVARAMYDGTAFKGWQTQDDERGMRTVQEMIGKQLTKRFNTKISCTGASRTDLGVHARGQAFHFDLPEPCDNLTYLEFTMNRMLPDDVRVFNISTAPLGTENQVKDDELWHATKSAVGKLYVYRFCTNLHVDPIRRRYCTHVYQPTDIVLLEKCLNVFVGTYDFQGFANKVACLTRLHEEVNKEFSTIRTVNSVKLIEDGEPGYYRIEFNLRSALYRMVRNMVGASLLVSQGGMSFELLQSLLVTGGKRGLNVSRPAPPEGLTLEHVYYDHY